MAKQKQVQLKTQSDFQEKIKRMYNNKYKL